MTDVSRGIWRMKESEKKDENRKSVSDLSLQILIKYNVINSRHTNKHISKCKCQQKYEQTNDETK